MSYEPDNEGTMAELQEAAENNDIVTNDELQEMYADMNLNEIGAKLDYDEQVLNAQNPSKPEEPRYAARKGMKTYHSGPKGVIADRNEAVLKMRAKRIQDKMLREKKVYMNLGNDSNRIQPFSLKYNRKDKKNKSESKHDSDSDLESDDSDEEAMRLYKEEKLKQIEKYRPKYGSCMEVTAWTFEEKVEHAPKEVFTVMHVYQDYMERCAHMNRALSDLAKAYQHVQFLRARSDRIALDEYPEIGLPTLIIWKNGEQLQNHIAMQNLVETPFTAKILEKFLIEKGVLEQNVETIEKPTESSKEEFIDKYGQKPLRSNNNHNEEDSDSELDID